MEVLNVIEAHFSGFQIFFGVIVGLSSVAALVGIFLDMDGNKGWDAAMCFIFSVAFGALSVYLLTVPEVPERIEVRITEPGYVIDAEQYAIIEKRGDIYVLERLEPLEPSAPK